MHTPLWQACFRADKLPRECPCNSVIRSGDLLAYSYPWLWPNRDRSEQWLLSLYEEDASPGASEGEPLSISLALNKGGGDGGDGVAAEVETVRVGLVAVDVRTGKVVHDTFVEGSGQRQELDTRLRHLRLVETATVS